eukprot:6191723-Pleurochrysis_carterae.AAC.2
MLVRKLASPRSSLALNEWSSCRLGDTNERDRLAVLDKVNAGIGTCLEHSVKSFPRRENSSQRPKGK